MGLSITWSIGKEGITGTRLDVPPYRVYFYFHDEHGLLEVQDFNLDELRSEIERRRTAGEDVEPFKQALKGLT